MLRRQVFQQLIEASARCHLNALVAEGRFASNTPEGFLFGRWIASKFTHFDQQGAAGVDRRHYNYTNSKSYT